SEYLPQCAMYPDLAGAINEGLYLVPHMDREQLRQAIVGQVRSGGAAITTAMVERLLEDASREADSLPIVQHALTQIWPARQPHVPIGLELYPRQGGLGAFIDQHAESVYGSLAAPVQQAAHWLFRSLTDVTTDGRPVRRPMGFDDIVKES